MASGQKTQDLRRKAPQLIAAGIAIAIIVIILLQILEDVLIEGAPITEGPFGALINAIILFTRNVTATVSSWGYTGIFTLMLLESSSLPIPSEVILPFAGYLISLGKLDVWITVFISTVAGITGALIDYYIGFRAAHALSEHRILGKVLFTRSQLDVVVRWFGKYDAFAVFFSRLIPGFRTIISFPAGAVKMRLGKFLVYTTAGCLAWNVLLIYIGYLLGSEWTKVAGVSHYLIIAVFAAVAIAFVIFLVWRHRKAGQISRP